MTTKKTSRPGIVILWCILGLMVAALVLGCLYLAGFVGGRTVRKDLTLAGVPLQGLDRKTAIALVRNAVADTYESGTFQVKVGEESASYVHTLSLTPEQTGAKLDVEKAVTALFLMEYFTDDLSTLSFLELDTESIRAALSPLAEHFPKTYEDSSYKVMGRKPDLDESHINAPVQKLVLYTGTPESRFSVDDLYAIVLESFESNQMEAVYNVPTTYPAAIDLDAINEKYYVAPVDAVMDMTTFQVSDHVYGYGIDLEGAKKALESASYGEEITLEFIRIDPENTKEELESLLYRDVLGTYTAYSSSSYNRDTNLRLSCEAINGVVLFPGETFSYNATLGERTPEKGYKQAAGYWGAEIVQSYGGGICQASSALYYCTLIADMEIVERHNHGYISAYMPFGMDATVDWSGPDYKFKNTTDYPIRIEAYASGGTVTVSIIGTDTKDYYVKMEYAVLDVDNYETVYEELPPDNEKGYKDGEVINDPYTGYTIETYQCRYDKETDELIEREFEVRSRYIKRDKLVCKIVEEEDEKDKDKDKTSSKKDKKDKDNKKNNKENG